MLLITGGSGFIGGRLAAILDGQGRQYRILSRRQQPGRAEVIHGDITDPASLPAACAGIECIYHCAGHAHAFAALATSEAKAHWQINCEGTRHLVRAAGQAGVRRFVFLSSVKAMAEPGTVCAAEDFPGLPTTDYGQAKRAAEEAVLEAGREFGMHVVNLRLAMVYGAGGHGNLERMGRLVRRGLFPPLPETGNHRSLVHVQDVLEAMLLVAEKDRARGQTYIVTGPEAPSGRQLYTAMRQVLGKPPCRWSVPVSLLRGAARCGDGLEHVLGRRLPLDSEVVERLLGSAWYSAERIAGDLGWRARISLDQGLGEMFGGGGWG